MKITKIVFLITLFFWVANFTLLAQEVVIQNFVNPNLLKQKHTTQKDLRGNDTLELPFFDDFSQNEIFPSAALWQDNDVFINSTFGINSPSVGVATLDLISSTGAIYPNAQYQFTFEADKLTSKPINLQDNFANVALSFFYQPQGIADAPETQDSLLLDFYAPTEKKWHNIWAKAGSANQKFEQVTLTISDPKYLQKGFQFRFRNYGTLSTASYASLAGNADQWNIDYIYLNKNRTTNSITDIAFTNSLKSILVDYQAVPWQHYKSLDDTKKQSITQTEIPIRISNLDDNLRLADSLSVTFKDLSGNTPTKKIKANGMNVAAHTQTDATIPFSYILPPNNDDTAEFSITTSFLLDNPNDRISNNSLTRIQVFKDFYAYDDGSAEAGYGLTGAGTKYGKIAYLFEPLKPDAIIGVEIYFCQTLNDASRKYFWLDIRAQTAANLPSDEKPLFSLEGARPEYENEVNKFHFYKFAEPVYVNKPFYVGWTQTTDDLLNVGLDLNGNAKNKLMYNIGNGWIQSTVDGAIMIRPVFAGNFTPAKKLETSAISEELPAVIGPNPVKDILTISLPSNLKTKIAWITLYNIYGEKILQKQNINSSEIDLTNLLPGIYIISIYAENGQSIKKKIIKQ